MYVICAPDSFKGSMTAPEAARRLAAAVRAVLPDAEIVELPDGIDHHWGGAGMIVGQAGGAQEGHLGAELAGQVGDLLIIGGDHNSAEAACCPGRLNGVGEHGLAAEGADILAGYAL